MNSQSRDEQARIDAIRVEDLDVGYGRKPLLKDLNFSVGTGEIVTILGGSGSGKSTLLKAIIGLLRPLKGRITIAGREITGKDSAESLAWTRRKTGVLFQSGALIGSLTLAENVALPLEEFSGLPAEMIRHIVMTKLEMVRLGDYGDYLPAELSGGMKKRAGLARAMALDPEILFCDEPSAGLDPVTSAELDELLLELNRTLGITLVVITHELASIENISHRSIMLSKDVQGIIAVGSPEELKTGSEDQRVQAFFRRQTREKARS